MVEDLAGEEPRTRPTSSDVTGERMSSTEPWWEGDDKSLGTDTDNAHNVSLTESRSLTIRIIIIIIIKNECHSKIIVERLHLLLRLYVYAIDRRFYFPTSPMLLHHRYPGNHNTNLRIHKI